MKKIFIIPLMLLVLLGLSSCYGPHHIDGNNNLITVSRTTGVFNSIESSGDLQVRIVRDSVCFVEVEGEENLIPYIDTDIQNGVLRIETQSHRNLDPNYPIIIYVHAPTLESIELSGSGSISSDTLSAVQLDVRLSGSGDINVPVLANKVNARISGSGDIHLSGSALQSDFSISGSGDLHAYSLQLSECIADIAGSGSMYLQVSDFLDVAISGSGNVYYYGNPSVSVSINGSGQVIHQ